MPWTSDQRKAYQARYRREHPAYRRDLMAYRKRMEGQWREDFLAKVGKRKQV